MIDQPARRGGRPAGQPLEVLGIFLKLGLSSFGGPIAHIGYFRDEFVTRRSWLDEVSFSDLLALCQFLPGPASSQLGFSIGLMRAVRTPSDFIVALLLGIILLVTCRAPPLLVVIAGALGGVAMALSKFPA